MGKTKKIVAAGIATLGLTVTAALWGAPAAQADVGVVTLTDENAAGMQIGMEDDVFDNVLTNQCDENTLPSGTTVVVVHNDSLEPVYAGAQCDAGYGPGVQVGPGGTATFDVTYSGFYVGAPAGV